MIEIHILQKFDETLIKIAMLYKEIIILVVIGRKRQKVKQQNVASASNKFEQNLLVKQIYK